ncbi:hypothetical protein HGB24_03425, partial [Candidatus Saccharibacteria bacterium]|nr:hypothetical protein [Candidatus Saccharibacteria bacterium]
MKNIKTTTAIILTAALISVAVGWRVINHEYAIAPNLEIVTTVSVIAAIVLGTRAALAVPLITMIASDLIIGNSSIFIYTWSSFALIGLGALVLKKLNAKPGRQIATSFGFAIASSFAFFAITNFGVWAQGWYPSTLAGLTQCY